MEATGNTSDRRTLRDRIRAVFATRAVRFPILLIVGAAATWLGSFYVQANYIELCEKFAMFPSRCAQVSLRTTYSVGLAIAGLVMLIMGPIFNSLYHLLRYGQAWESSRVENAISNYPLLAGAIYLAGAALLSLT
jgi:hypothetical protein